MDNRRTVDATSLLVGQVVNLWFVLRVWILVRENCRVRLRPNDRSYRPRPVIYFPNINELFNYKSVAAEGGEKPCCVCTDLNRAYDRAMSSFTIMRRAINGAVNIKTPPCWIRHVICCGLSTGARATCRPAHRNTRRTTAEEAVAAAAAVAADYK